MHIQIIDRKYLEMHITDQELYEITTKIFVDFFIYKANLKRKWRDHNIFYFDMGFFGYRFALRFMWNFIQRDRSEKEERDYQRMQEFLRSVEETKDK